MDKRYQVFVSSTFRDLEAERQAALDAILELGHFPAGMEAFPAASATPWDLIRTIIADCDYYVLIIGGRYGSLDASGISYTEKEYDLAHELGIPILVFPHSNTGDIPSKNVDSDPALKEKLDAFRAKASQHTTKAWANPDMLKGQVLQSLVHEMRVNPRIGWIRGNNRDKPETLRKINELLEQNAILSRDLENLRRLQQSSPLGESLYAFDGQTVELAWSAGEFDWLDNHVTISLAWSWIFEQLAPHMMIRVRVEHLQILVMRLIVSEVAKKVQIPKKVVPYPRLPNELPDKDWERILCQFLALGYWESISWTETRLVPQITGSSSSDTHTVAGLKLTALGLQRYAEKTAMKKETAALPNVGL